MSCRDRGRNDCPRVHAVLSFLNVIAGWPKSGAIVADFAVLNSIRDLPTLFRTFDAHLISRGLIVTSLLNPSHWSGLQNPNWWKNYFAGGRSHPISTDLFPAYLHPIQRVLAAARNFSLTARANAGSLVRLRCQGRPGYATLLSNLDRDQSRRPSGSYVEEPSTSFSRPLRISDTRENQMKATGAFCQSLPYCRRATPIKRGDPTLYSRLSRSPTTRTTSNPAPRSIRHISPAECTH